MTKTEKSKIIEVWLKLHPLLSTFDYSEEDFPKGKENYQKKLCQEMWDIIDPMVCRIKGE